MIGWAVALGLYFLGLYLHAWALAVVAKSQERTTKGVFAVAIFWPIVALVFFYLGATGKAAPSNGTFQVEGEEP